MKIKALLLFLFLSTTLLAPFTLEAQRSVPVVHQDMVQSFTTGTRPWVAPTYSLDGDLSEGFKYPDAFEKRVGFWRDIYSKYSTWQGVLHDSVHPWIVYRVIDFSDLVQNDELSDVEKERRKRERVEAQKKEVSQVFVELRETLARAAEPVGESLLIYQKFQSVSDPKKFEEAGRVRRIRFQLGQRDRFLLGIYYSGRYREYIEKTFSDMGLPLELSRLPMVESSFNIFAQSRVGASGLWQIMPRVGRELGLRVDAAVDERNDPWLSTVAAAKILRNNYRMLEDWPLALTGYNHGAFGVRRRIRSSSATNLFELVEQGGRGSFGFASKNFYASFVAAVQVEVRSRDLFEEMLLSKPLPQKEIETPRAVSWKELVDWFDGDIEMAKVFNPHLTYAVRRGDRPIPTGIRIYVLKTNHERAVREISGPGGSVHQLGSQTYVVKPGDTLSGIASRLGVSAGDLQKLNDISHPSRIQVGQELSVPR